MTDEEFKTPPPSEIFVVVADVGEDGDPLDWCPPQTSARAAYLVGLDCREPHRVVRYVVADLPKPADLTAGSGADISTGQAELPQTAELHTPRNMGISGNTTEKEWITRIRLDAEKMQPNEDGGRFAQACLTVLGELGKANGRVVDLEAEIAGLRWLIGKKIMKETWLKDLLREERRRVERVGMWGRSK